jgi:hypothetical protein
LASDAKDWGKNVIESFADGIENAVEDVKEAAKKGAQAVKDFLGVESPTDKGPLSDGIKQWGANSTKAFADGQTENIDEIEKSSEKAAGKSSEIFKEEDYKVGEEVNQQTNSSSSSSSQKKSEAMSDIPGAGGKEINVNEKAIFFQKGAFQGVSDEELPGKVREIIDKSTTEIIKDLEAKGVEVEQ